MKRAIEISKENIDQFDFTVFNEYGEVLSTETEFALAEAENDLGFCTPLQQLSYSLLGQCRLFNGNIIRGTFKRIL